MSMERAVHGCALNEYRARSLNYLMAKRRSDHITPPDRLCLPWRVTALGRFGLVMGKHELPSPDTA
jgi:hypothetical protein